MNERSEHASLDSKIYRMIQSIENIELYLKSKIPDNDPFNSGPNFISVEIEKLKNTLGFLSAKGKEGAISLLNSLTNNILSIKKTADAQEKFVKENPGEKLDLYNIYMVESELGFDINSRPEYLEYEVNRVIEPDEINTLINQIQRKYPNIKLSQGLLNQYVQASHEEKYSISTKLLDLRNESVRQKNDYSDTYIKNLALEIDLLISTVGVEQKINKINDGVQIIEQVKNNQSLESIRKIETGYESEASLLIPPIANINSSIKIIFIIIISAITIKTIIYYIFKPELFSNLPDILLSISLLLAFSALVTYLIKERNRLIKLHDHYKLCDLELKSITSYMNELNQDQRQQTLIKLSANYFNGSNRKPDVENAASNDVNEITKAVSEFTKAISEFKKMQ